MISSRVYVCCASPKILKEFSENRVKSLKIASRGSAPQLHPARAPALDPRPCQGGAAPLKTPLGLPPQTSLFLFATKLPDEHIRFLQLFRAAPGGASHPPLISGGGISRASKR